MQNFEQALDAWITREPDYDEEEGDVELPMTDTITRKDGRFEEMCTCKAYKFPHRAGSGKCKNEGWTSHKRKR